MKLWAKENTGLAIIALVLSVLMSGVNAFAHGGEDHGDEKKAPVVSNGAGTVIRVARVGDLEVTFKHPPIEPDKGTTARVFVTRFDSNEPVDNARIFVILGDAGAIPEAAATVGVASGIYEVKLSPMPKGQYKLAVRIEANGATETAQFGAIEVAPAPASPAENSSGWARTALVVLALLAALGIGGAILYRVVQSFRRDRVKADPITA